MTATVGVLPLTDPDIETYFRAHYGRLVRALTLVSGSEEAAADAVQEAFVKAHLRWRKVSQYDDPIGWIRRVAINRLRDEHRRGVRKERAMDRYQAGETGIIDGPEFDDTAAQLAGVVGDLPRQQRLAIALYYLEGLSVAQVASTLDLSEGAVKFHLHKGRERLRSVLTEGQEFR